MQADFQVGQEHQFGASLAVRFAQRRMIVRESAAQQALPVGRIATPQVFVEPVDCRPVRRAIVEQSQKAGEGQSNLLEDLAIAAGHGLGRPFEGGRRIDGVAHDRGGARQTLSCVLARRRSFGLYSFCRFRYLA